MSTQTRTVKVRIPMVLTTYNRPLFLHHLQLVLGDGLKHVGFREGVDTGEIITVEGPMGAFLPKDVIGHVKACLKSVGIEAQPEEV